MHSLTPDKKGNQAKGYLAFISLLIAGYEAAILLIVWRRLGEWLHRPLGDWYAALVPMYQPGPGSWIAYVILLLIITCWIVAAAIIVATVRRRFNWLSAVMSLHILTGFTFLLSTVYALNNLIVRFGSD